MLIATGPCTDPIQEWFPDPRMIPNFEAKLRGTACLSSYQKLR